MFLCSFLVYSKSSVIAGFFNDNYTGSLDNGVNGRYIGADDFLTFALFVKGEINSLEFSLTHQLVTSRKYYYRYDLINTSLGYNLNFSDLEIQPYLGFILKGEYGGDYIQNSIHDFRGIPSVSLDYKEFQERPIIGVTLKYLGPLLLDPNNEVSTLFNLDVPTGIKPINSSLFANYLIHFNNVSFEFLGGYRYFLNTIKDYSDFVRSGVIVGGQVKFIANNYFTINAGCYLFPTSNLENDPEYAVKNFPYSPQFWVSFGIGGFDLSIADIIRT
ncbi:MAG: hypothetical protein B6229_09005 [Spirochaetaceae bacterium 4572_7]|nr:MAG: hypothetical protein B6229_09005 [Spirochaetaceae bacterium 4572_7]